MDEPTPAMVMEIRAAHTAGSSPSQILARLRADGGGREIADYLRIALDLNPDSIAYIYAWLRKGIDDARLDELIETTRPPIHPNEPS
ncbi:MAG TPA: hypothetical protein VD886_12050 [Herpetosiphonaceae bacterium]|nr:hypothetical protein [Herpetosiphonaceae bacterium]